MDKATAAILLTLVAHIAGMGVLIWLALDGSGFDWRAWWPRDDHGGGGGDDRSPEPPAPVGGVPLLDADPASARLRTEHDALPRRRSRRPRHAPVPERTREPV